MAWQSAHQRSAVLPVGQILDTSRQGQSLLREGNTEGKNVGRELFLPSCWQSCNCCGPICCESFKAVDLQSWALIHVTPLPHPWVLLTFLWGGPVSKAHRVLGLLRVAHLCAYKSFCSFCTQGEDESVLLRFPQCWTPEKLPMSMGRIFPSAADVEWGHVIVVLKAMVAVLL